VPNDPSFRFTESDREELAGRVEVSRPEQEQIYPTFIAPKDPESPRPAERLASTRSKASEVLAKIDELTQRVDEKCARFKASSSQGKGSPLFQAMVRVFNERTTTITYNHYKRALEYRQQLAAEDSKNMRVT